MPEDAYRQLSDEERAEIIRLRSEKGYPLHSPPHPFRQAGTYAITVATYQHAHLINSSHRRTDFESRLLKAFEDAGSDLLGWVILTNHYHFLIGVQSLDSVSSTLKLLHGRTSHDWDLEDGLAEKRRVWYRFYDRQIRNEKHFLKAMNYIHFNPVKHQYVDSPYDWPWTSLHLYYEDKGREWLRKQWRAYPLDDGIAEEFQE